MRKYKEDAQDNSIQLYQKYLQQLVGHQDENLLIAKDKLYKVLFFKPKNSKLNSSTVMFNKYFFSKYQNESLCYQGRL